MRRPRRVSQRALCSLHTLLTLCPCCRATHLLVLGGLCLLRSPDFSRRLHQTTVCVSSHGIVFRVVRTTRCRLGHARGGPRNVNVLSTGGGRSHADDLVSRFLSSVPASTRRGRGGGRGHGPAPTSTTMSCMSCLVRARARRGVRRPSHAVDLVSSFVRRNNFGLRGVGNARRSRPGSSTSARPTRTTPRGRSDSGNKVFARALTEVCVGRKGCRETCRVVSHLRGRRPRGDTCCMSRLEFLRGLVLGTGGWCTLRESGGWVGWWWWG